MRPVAPWRARDGSFSWLRLGALLGLFAPALWIGAQWIGDNSGLRGLRAMLFDGGLWSARLLVLSLAMGPLSRILRWPRLITLRRMVGVSSFAYGALHFTAYGIGQTWNLNDILHGILFFLYLTIGTVALLAMAALATTSNDYSVRRLGGKSWRSLHRLAFGIAALMVAHFLLANRARASEALVLAGILLWLLVYRRLTQGKGRAMRPLHLVVLAVVMGVLTAAGEFAWYALGTGLDPWRVLGANLTLAAGLRPAWWVLGIGMAVAALAGMRRQRLRKEKQRTEIQL